MGFVGLPSCSCLRGCSTAERNGLNELSAQSDGCQLCPVRGLCCDSELAGAAACLASLACDSMLSPCAQSLLRREMTVFATHGINFAQFLVTLLADVQIALRFVLFGVLVLTLVDGIL